MRELRKCCVWVMVALKFKLQPLRDCATTWFGGGEPQSFQPAKSLHFTNCGGSLWRPRLRDLREKALPMSPEVVCTINAEAAGTRGWGAPLGDSFM